MKNRRAQSVLESKLPRAKSHRVGQLKSRTTNDAFPLHSPPIELKSLSGGEIVASLKATQEGNRVTIVGPSRNKSLNLYEEARPIRQQQRRMNLTILDVVKKDI
ncbi:hypothetical protein CR513_32810, partial [Mucuna pruriens]